MVVSVSTAAAETKCTSNAALCTGTDEWCVPKSTTLTNSDKEVENETTDLICVKCTATEGSNDDNVDNMEKVFTSSNLASWFPNAAGTVYTYAKFKKAVKMFSKFCDASGDACRKMLAIFFTHACQESGCLQYVEETQANRDAHPEYGDYYGRGVFQLTWPKNYMSFSKAVFGDERCLLGAKKSEVATDGKLAWAVGIWFALNNPSEYNNMKTFVDATTTKYTISSNGFSYRNGFALTNLAINGDLECGSCPRDGSEDHAQKRIEYFKTFCGKFTELKDWQWCTDAKSDTTSEQKGADCTYMTENIDNESFNAKKDSSCDYKDASGNQHTDPDRD